MRFRKLSSEVQAVIIIAIVVSTIGTAIFFGWRFRTIEQIEIFDDKDFSQKYHFPGSGTEDDPYIIDGYELSGNSHHNIRIVGITKYFIIQNCILEKSSKGMDLVNLTYGVAQILSNTIRDNDFGIIIRGYNNCIISNNTFINNHQAIEAGTGSYTIQSNILINNKYDHIAWIEGMNFSDNNNTRIEDNTFDSFNSGLVIYRSENILTKRNNFTNCILGFYAEEVMNIIIGNNSATNCSLGFGICQSQNIDLVNNTSVDNRGNGFYLETINKCLITGNNGSGNSDFGIRIYWLTNSNCCNNFFNGNNKSGISMWASDISSINNNSFVDNGLGMELFCSNITQINCNIIQRNLEYGIVTQGVNTTIYNNNFIDNNYINITTIHSQARSNGNCSFDGTYYEEHTKWHNEVMGRGNYWSELVWYTGVEYTIDPGNYTDSYPLEEPVTINL